MSVPPRRNYTPTGLFLAQCELTYSTHVCECPATTAMNWQILDNPVDRRSLERGSVTSKKGTARPKPGGATLWGDEGGRNRQLASCPYFQLHSQRPGGLDLFGIESRQTYAHPGHIFRAASLPFLYYLQTRIQSEGRAHYKKNFFSTRRIEVRRSNAHLASTVTVSGFGRSTPWKRCRPDCDDLTATSVPSRTHCPTIR